MNYLSSSFRLAGIAALGIGLLSACSDLQSLQERFAADPQLTANDKEVKSDSPAKQEDRPVVNLPADFPVAIPTIPRSQLIAADGEGKTFWQARQSGDRIFNFYREALPANGWEIIESVDPQTEGNKSLTASLEDLEINISVEPDRPNELTSFAIAYHRNEKITTPQPTNEFTTTDRDKTENKPERSSGIETKKSAPTSYSDLDKTPEQLRPYVKEVVALGSIAVSAEDYNRDRLFQPNKAIKRREFARWLVTTNNIMYSHRPSQEIRLATANKEPVFKDIPVSDPDFPYIQGLAETGIVPSILTGDSSQILFRPDAPLTREDLIAWKVPLDIRRSLPSASIEAIEKTWGFEDTAQIDPLALRSLFADFQNGENSNVRRSFGYTILFQPNKTVTRAEAAAAFWYFGYQGDGISAEEALKILN